MLWHIFHTCQLTAHIVAKMLQLLPSSLHAMTLKWARTDYRCGVVQQHANWSSKRPPSADALS